MDNEERRKVIEAFLTFAESQGVTLGGDDTYGFAMELSEFRPLHPEDYPALISGFISNLQGGQ